MYMEAGSTCWTLILSYFCVSWYIIHNMCCLIGKFCNIYGLSFVYKSINILGIHFFKIYCDIVFSKCNYTLGVGLGLEISVHGKSTF